MWELWGVEISAFPLTWHIAYTTACCYRTSRDLSCICGDGHGIFWASEFLLNPLSVVLCLCLVT